MHCIKNFFSSNKNIKSDSYLFHRLYYFLYLIIDENTVKIDLNSKSLEISFQNNENNHNSIIDQIPPYNFLIEIIQFNFNFNKSNLNQLSINMNSTLKHFKENCIKIDFILYFFINNKSNFEEINSDNIKDMYNDYKKEYDQIIFNNNITEIKIDKIDIESINNFKNENTKKFLDKIISFFDEIKTEKKNTEPNFYMTLVNSIMNCSFIK